MGEKTEYALAPVFSKNFYAAKSGLLAYETYGLAGIEKILLLLHQYNLKSLGIDCAGTEDAELMKEMVVKMVFN
jgi:DNA polymerase-3 subunit delta